MKTYFTGVLEFIFILLLNIQCSTITNKSRLSFISDVNPKEIRLLILPLENKGPSQYSWISVGFTDSLSTELSKLPDIKTISEEDRLFALKEIARGQRGIFKDSTITNPGSLLGANYILSGKVTITGNFISVLIKITQTEMGYTVKSIKVDGSIEGDGIFEVQEKILNNLIENYDQNEYSKIYFREAPNYLAFSNYSKGLEFKQNDLNKSSKFFKKSLEEYPNYVSAMQELIQINNKLNNFKESNFYIQKINSVLNNSSKDPKRRAELLNIEGEVSYFNGDYNLALNKLNESEKILNKDLSEINPQIHAKNLYVIGKIYLKLNKKSEALEKFSNSRLVLERNLLTKTKLYSDVSSSLKESNQSTPNPVSLIPTDKNAEELIEVGLDFYSKEKPELGRPYILRGIQLYKNQGDLRNVEKYELILQKLDNKTNF